MMQARFVFDIEIPGDFVEAINKVIEIVNHGVISDHHATIAPMLDRMGYPEVAIWIREHIELFNAIMRYRAAIQQDGQLLH